MKTTHDEIKKYLKARNWHTNEPVDVAKSIVIEAAELLELFQWNNKKRVQVIKDKKFMEDLRGELADIFIYAFGMAITLDLDPEEVVAEKLKHVEEKYPAAKIKADRKNYLKIKQEYRRNRK